MSLQYEDDLPMTELDRLMQRNAEAVETIQRTPYQPIVWAIPDDIRQQEQALLAQAVQFQPRLYQLIDQRPTRTEVEQYVYQLENHNDRTMQSIQTSLRQVGNEREQHSSTISKMLSDSLKAMEDTAAKLERRTKKLFAITVAASVVASVLVCVVWQWLLR